MSSVLYAGFCVLRIFQLTFSHEIRLVC